MLFVTSEDENETNISHDFYTSTTKRRMKSSNLSKSHDFDNQKQLLCLPNIEITAVFRTNLHLKNFCPF